MRDHAVPATTTEPSAAGDIPRDQAAGSRSRVRRRTFRRLWLRSVVGAAVVSAGLAALTFGAGAAHADTLPNGALVQLGQYPIPSTPAAGFSGGDALPTIPGTLGNPTELFMNQGGSSSQVLGVRGGSSAWATPTETEAATGSTGQIWRFQLVGSIAVLTQTSQEIATHENPSGLLQDVPVYKIISYHPDGTHTCLDAFGGSGAAGTMVNSDECDPYQFNQTNQLWIIGNTEQDNSMMNSEGQTYMFTPGDPATTPFFPRWLTSNLQANPWHGAAGVYGDPNSVIESVASVQASGLDTTKAPVLSASYNNLLGVNSAIWLQTQQWPVLQANSTWLIHDTTTTTAGSGSASNQGPGSSANCAMYSCLLG
jgi:hypothetical protein